MDQYLAIPIILLWEHWLGIKNFDGHISCTKFSRLTQYFLHEKKMQLFLFGCIHHGLKS